ncbi:MAG: PAS domain S-box protein [Candidatus Delongbacteria bacterium]|nr:PAS domain S-box protein [Candidatus Delongbacteria bacterium]MBN2834504.1 PAS domain S-box protein [Candidatus Delongbacteria bacterium]
MSDTPLSIQDLRKRAEEILASKTFDTELEKNSHAIINELHIHQVELEMQNDELMRTQEDLERQKNRFARLFNFAPTGYLIVDFAGTIVKNNDTFLRMLCLENESLRNRHISKYMLPVDEKIFRSRFQSFYNNPMGKNIEVRFVKNNGKVFWGRIEGLKYFDNDNVETGELLLSISDITDMKNIEAEILKEREQLSVTLKNIGDGVITTDSYGNIILMNEAAESITGWTLGETSGKSLTKIFDIYDVNRRELIENPVSKVLKEHQIVDFRSPVRINTKNMTEKILTGSCSPLFDSTGNINGSVLVFRDDTDVYLMAEQLKKTEKLESLGSMASGIAHDFNNLLGGLFGYLESISRKYNDPEKVITYVTKAFDVFEKTKSLTHQLLTFSKGGTPLKKSGDIVELVKNVATSILSNSNIAFDFIISPYLYNCEFDEYQIRQAFENIILNSKEELSDNGIIQIEVKNQLLTTSNQYDLPAGQYLRFEFRDNGNGISPDITRKVFDPFFTTKHSNGMGLTTAYSIIKNHNGCIEIDSVVSMGTSVNILIPAVEANSRESMKEAQTLKKLDVVKSVLILDDEPFIREIVEEVLKGEDFDVYAAKDGESALNISRELQSKNLKIDLAILDLTIPNGLGGKEIVKELSEINPRIIKIASSGYSDDPVISNPKSFGFTDSIQKPYRTAELLKLIANYLKN